MASFGDAELAMRGIRTRTTDFSDPSLTAEAAAGKPGIEFLRELIRGEAPTAPIQVTLGFELVEVEDGFARAQLVAGEHLCGTFNTVHSGVASTLLDACMTAAVVTTLDAVTAPTNATVTVHFTRPITARMVVVGEGWVVHRGSRLVTAEGRLADDQGRLLAHASATYALVPR
jgi:uncharacterized protein (TIGR00369 family)